MSWWEAIILGIVQGLTEFLPVSSSAHLVIFQKLLGSTENNLSFDIAVHLGTLLSVFTIYRVLLWDLTKEAGQILVHPKKSFPLNPKARVGWMVILATIPTAIIGLSFKHQFEEMFNNLKAVGFFLMVTGTFLFLTRNLRKGDMAHQSLELVNSEISAKKALIIGLIQGAAIAPGISRSGSTIAAGLAVGLSRDSAPLFSFLLSIPAILGAAVLQLKDFTWTSDSAIPMITGIITSYIFGLVGLSAVLKVVRSGRLEVFSIYLWIVGGATLGYALFH